MRHLATERAEGNAQSNNAAMNVITRDQLLGDGQWQTTAQQLGLSDLALEQTAKIVKKAWMKLPVPSDGHSPGFASIRQGATESYSDFVSRLLVAVERQIDNHKARAMLQKQLAYENANEDCRTALTPIYSNPGTTIQDMLRVCQNIGTISHKAALFAATQQAARQSYNSAQGKKCFGCGGEGNFHSQCQSTPRQQARPLKNCPICLKGFHWANQYRSRSSQDASQQPPMPQPKNQGNGWRGRPQAL